MSKSLNSDITKLITKYLSIREHSKLELKNKLIEKGFDSEEILLSINEFAAKNIQKVPNIVQLFLQFGLMGTGIDINFMYNDFDWKCNIFLEVKAPEQPLVIYSKNVHQPNEDQQ